MIIFLAILALVVVVTVFASSPDSLNYRSRQVHNAYRARTSRTTLD